MEKVNLCQAGSCIMAYALTSSLTLKLQLLGTLDWWSAKVVRAAELGAISCSHRSHQREE